MASNKTAPSLLTADTVLFLIGVIFSSSIALENCANLPFGFPTPFLEEFLGLCLIAWITLSLVFSDETTPGRSLDFFIFTFLTLLILCSPLFYMAALSFITEEVAEAGYQVFALSLIPWFIFLLLDLLGEDESTNGIEKFIMILGALWSYTGILLTLGQFPPFNFSKNIFSNHKDVQITLDIRFATTLFFFTIIFATALRRALGAPSPARKFFSPPEISKEDLDYGIFTILFAPFASIINKISAALTVIFEYVFRIAEILFHFFYRTGKEATRLVAQIFLSSPFWKSLTRLLSLYLLIFLSLKVSLHGAPLAQEYLLERNWTVQLKPLALLSCQCLIIITLLYAVGIVLGFDYDHLLLAFATLLSIFFVAGIFVHAASRHIQISGFGQIGIFSSLIVLMISIGIAQVVIKRF